MPQALSSLGGLFGGGGTPSWLKLLLGGLAGGGEIGNLLADRQRASLLNKENAWANLTPQQLAAKVSAATKPLDAGLTQAVGNTVQGQMGERGLAESPGVYSATLSQALAPYYQQNQATGLDLIMKQMGIPVAEAGLLPGMTNMGPLLALLMKSMQKPTSGAGGAPSLTPDVTSGLNTDILQNTGSTTTGDTDWINNVFPATDGVPA
jgi:hypothetical protein